MLRFGVQGIGYAGQLSRRMPPRLPRLTGPERLASPRMVTWREQAGPSAAAAQARDVARLRAAAIIHISTALAVHSLAGADQRLYLKYPQDCAQGVILAGQAVQVSMSRGRKPVISRQPSSRTGKR